MEWLITGGCGFIGTRLVAKLLRDGEHTIRIVDDCSRGSRQTLKRVCEFREGSSGRDDSTTCATNAPVELICADVLDEATALETASGADVIVHLAASTGVVPSVEDPRRDCTINILGTLNYLESARRNGVPRFIVASSGAVIGLSESLIHEGSVPHPTSPYGASKLACEAYVSAYWRAFGVTAVALRFANVYGPGCDGKDSVIARFIRQALRGEVLEIYGDGQQSRDFVYIDDLVRAIQLAASAEQIGGEVFQIASGTETTIQEIVEELRGMLADFGVRNVCVRETSSRKGEVRRVVADPSKAREMLAWKSTVGLRDGLRRTVEWYLRLQSAESNDS